MKEGKLLGNEIIESKEVLNISNIDNVNILITDADKMGTNVAEMSDFFGLYIEKLTYDLRGQSVGIKDEMPIAEISILNDVIQYASVAFGEKYTLIPDLEHLPKDVKTKLEKGIYRIADSKQVEGNVRAVIVNQDNVRVRDITLKRVENITDSAETIRSIANQMQLRQISKKLDGIQMMQDYQLEQQRNQKIIEPFLTARDYIKYAQNTDNADEKKENISWAIKQLTMAINAAYVDLDTAIRYLDKVTVIPLLRLDFLSNKLMMHIIQDLQLVTKFVGIQTQLLECIGNKRNAKEVLDTYNYKMIGFATGKIGTREISAAELLHDLYNYTERKDTWLEFANSMYEVIDRSTKLTDSEDVYLVHVEDE